MQCFNIFSGVLISFFPQRRARLAADNPGVGPGCEHSMGTAGVRWWAGPAEYRMGRQEVCGDHPGQAPVLEVEKL